MEKWDQILAGNLAMRIPFRFVNEFTCSIKGMITTDYFTCVCNYLGKCLY
jgi:hypothetical protein